MRELRTPGNRRACWRFPRDEVIYERSTPFPRSHPKTVGRPPPPYHLASPHPPTNYCVSNIVQARTHTHSMTTTRGNCWYCCRMVHLRGGRVVRKDGNIVKRNNDFSCFESEFCTVEGFSISNARFRKASRQKQYPQHSYNSCRYDECVLWKMFETRGMICKNDILISRYKATLACEVNWINRLLINSMHIQELLCSIALYLIYVFEWFEG